MTWKKIDPSEMGDYIGRYARITSDYGWDMDDWTDCGYLRGIEGGYFYLDDDAGDDYEHFTDLGGSAINCIRSVEIRLP